MLVEPLNVPLQSEVERRAGQKSQCRLEEKSQDAFPPGYAQGAGLENADGKHDRVEDRHRGEYEVPNIGIQEQQEEPGQAKGGERAGNHRHRQVS